MMSAPDTLRRAAALMRERAEAADLVTLHRPWDSDGEQVTGGDGQWMLVATTTDVLSVSADSATAAHIASWRPAVAFAVADWLDELAAEAECAEDWCPDLTRPDCVCSRCRRFGPGLDAARAYLADDSCST